MTDEKKSEIGMNRRDFLKMTGSFGAALLAASQGFGHSGLAMAKDMSTKQIAGTEIAGTDTTGWDKMAKSRPMTNPKKNLPREGFDKSESKSQVQQVKPTDKVMDMQNIDTVYNPEQMIPVHEFPNLDTVEGLSNSQIEQHLALYHGYVKKANALTKKIRGFHAADDPRLFRAMHIDQSYSLNGALLHQYYFENMGGKHTPPSAWFKDLVEKEFYSWNNYVEQFTMLGKKFRGWVMTGYNMLDHRIHNYGLDTHNEYYPAHVIPILVMDVYEHAYMIDFGTDRGRYLDAFKANIDWAVVEARLKTMALHYVPHS